MKSIPVAKPSLGAREEKALIEAARSGWVAQGPKVAAFEAAVAKEAGTRHAVAVTSCTTAMFLMLKALGVGRGDEVIVPSLSFIATANAVVHAGAKPVFADIHPRTFNISPKCAVEALTKKTKAILAVHQIGQPADMDALARVLKGRPEVALLEDAACAIGARYRGRPCGGLGLMAAFSFHPRKIVTTGEGGMITTNDDALADWLRSARSHCATAFALDRHKAGGTAIESYPEVGYNFRMTDFQGAVGVEQMRRLPDMLKKRKAMAARYDRAFADLKNVATPYVPAWADCTYQSYMVLLKGPLAGKRDEVMVGMEARGVSVRRAVMAIHLEPCYRRRRDIGPLPATERAAAAGIILPLFADMKAGEQARVVKSFIDIAKSI